MTTPSAQMSGKVLLSIANIFMVVGTYAADWNHTHIYNDHWPPHAKFHNGQTMAMSVLLALASLYFMWRRQGDEHTNILAATVLGALYWVSQGLANLYPGVAWTDPEFLKAGQSLTDISPQMVLDVVFCGVIGIAWLLAGRRRTQGAA